MTLDTSEDRSSCNFYLRRFRCLFFFSSSLRHDVRRLRHHRSLIYPHLSQHRSLSLLLLSSKTAIYKGSNFMECRNFDYIYSTSLFRVTRFHCRTTLQAHRSFRCWILHNAFLLDITYIKVIGKIK